MLSTFGITQKRQQEYASKFTVQKQNITIIGLQTISFITRIYSEWVTCLNVLYEFQLKSKRTKVGY